MKRKTNKKYIIAIDFLIDSYYIYIINYKRIKQNEKTNNRF